MNEQMMHTQKNGITTESRRQKIAKKVLNYKPGDIRGPQQPRNR
jgi:hypothetical protein